MPDGVLGCERCGRPVPDLDSPELRGWQVSDDGTAVCPDCAAAAEGDDTREGA